MYFLQGANQSGEPSADGALFCSFFITGSLGLIINGLLLAIVLNKKELRQADYMAFIINRASIDAFFCLQALVLQPLGIWFWLSDPVWCRVAGGIANSTVFAMLVSEPVLAVDRYVSICQKNRYQKLFGKRGAGLVCLVVWLIGALCTVPHIFTGSLGRVSGYFCCVIIEWRFFLTISLSDTLVLLISYSVILFCYWNIYQTLKRHQAQGHQSDHSSKLQEDKSLLRYIGAAALLPLLTDTPLAIAATIRMIDETLMPDLIIFFGNLILLLFPVINPVLILFMISPIRKRFLEVLHTLRRGNQVSNGSGASGQASAVRQGQRK